MKYLQEELRKIEKQAVGQFDRFQLIEKDISGNSAAITLERTVRANETESLAQQIESIVSSGARISTFEQATPPASAVEGDLWINTGDNRKLNRYSAASGWHEITDSRVTANTAAITTEQTARQDADAALASQIVTVSASASRQRITRGGTAPTSPAIGDLWIDTSTQNRYRYWSGTAWVASDDLRIAENASAITTETTARTTADSALSTRLDTVESNTNTALSNLNARIATEESTRSTADSAAATRLTAVEATSSKVRVFRQSTTPTAYFVGDQWYDTANGNKLRVWNGSSWVDTDNAAIATTAAAVATETTARIAGDTALASQVTSLSSTVGGHTTSITSLSSSINGTQGRFGITIDNNGFISGISLLSDTSNGNPTSVFRVAANQFAIRTPGASTDSIFWDGSSLVVRGNILATSVQVGAVTNGIETIAADSLTSVPGSSTSFTVTHGIGSLTTSGGRLIGNIAMGVIASVQSTSVASIRVTVQAVINGVPYGYARPLHLPVMLIQPPTEAPVNRQASFTIPLIFDAGPKTGAQAVSAEVRVSYYNASGAAVAPGGLSGSQSTVATSFTGYLQEVRA